MVTGPLQNELTTVKQEILKMGRLLEDQVFKSVKSLVDKDLQLAKEVCEKDDVIDAMELVIEKRCLQLIALKQPMASDLRLIGTALRIIVDIERMADHAEDISKIAINLHDQKYIKPLIDIPRMGTITQEMIQVALKAFFEADTKLAMSIIDMEIQMDALYDQVFRELLSYMIQDPKNIPQATSLLLVAGHLERIADHATNIAEMIIYVVEGRRIDLNEIARKSES